MNTNIMIDHEPVADGGWLVRALLKIEGETRTDENRTPLNLSLVLDRSGSMGGEPLAAVKKAAALLVQRLDPSDTLSVVAYDDGVTVIAPPSKGAEQPDLVNDIHAIQTGSTTNLSGGWLQGRQFVSEHAREGSVNRILLLTDGLANVGITDPAKLVGLCRNAAADGITTTTIGFGEGYDEDLLTAMADAGGGGAYYIEEPDQAPAVFAEELSGLLSIAAQNVRVSITVADAAESCRVLHTYPASQGGEALVLDLGDLYAREPRPVLAEFLMKPAENVSAETSGDEIPVGMIVVTGDVLTADGGVEQRTITIPIRLSPVEGGIAVPEVRRELILLEAVKEREKALEAKSAGEFREARNNLSMLSARIEAFDPADAVLREEASDLRRMVASLHDDVVTPSDRKYMRYRARYASQGKREAVQSVSRDVWDERRNKPEWLEPQSRDPGYSSDPDQGSDDDVA